MEWHHECYEGWLRARRSCLTATDVKELLPVTKTGRKRSVDEENFLKVLARKKTNITKDDCKSSGAMARGHVLEPFAISRFNTEFDKEMNHWDDVVVTREEHEWGDLAFSPDGLDVVIPKNVANNAYPMGPVSGTKELIEVKCYNNERHLVCGCTDKKKLEERWQIATAFAVQDSLETAFLVFFNPSMEYQMFVIQYDRADLEDEIGIVLEIEEDWKKWLVSYDVRVNHLIGGDPYEEGNIIRKIVEMEKLSPVKTVVL